MKNVSIILLSVAVAMCLSLISCSGSISISGEKSPSDIEMGMWKLVQKGNYKKVADYWLENSVDEDFKDGSKEQIKMMSSMFSEKMKESMEEKGGLKDFKIESEEISEDGTTATVEVLLTYGDGSTEEHTSKYKKVDDKWKMNNSMK